MSRNLLSIPFWDGDDSVSIKELEEIVTRIKKEYGANSRIYFDAGHSNIEVLVAPSKNVKDQE